MKPAGPQSTTSGGLERGASPLAGRSVRIVSARLRTLRPQPLPQPFQDGSLGPFTSVGMAILTLRDADGAEGEAPLAAGIEPLSELLLPRLLAPGAPRGYDRLFASLYWGIRNAGFRGPASGALGAIDLALHDLAARRAGRPLHRFLGADRDWAGVYASGGGTNRRVRDLVREVGGYLEHGYRVVKIKVGRRFGSTPAVDVQRVRAVRRAFGFRFVLAVDANQVWSAPAAADFARRLAEWQPAWLEEPVHSADLLALRAVAAASPVPLAAGESEHSERVFPSLLAAGVAHLQPIYHRLPSIAACRQILRTPGVQVSSGGFTPAAAQLVALGPGSALTEYLVATNAPWEPWLAVQPRRERDRLWLPDNPGSSMQVDWRKARREGLVIRDQLWTARSLAGADIRP